MLAKPTKKVKQKTDFLEPEPEQIKAENFIFDANKKLFVENPAIPHDCFPHAHRPAWVIARLGQGLRLDDRSAAAHVKAQAARELLSVPWACQAEPFPYLL